MRNARNPLTIHRFVITVDGLLGVDGSGVMAGVITMDPSTCTQWASLTPLYDQFRVLGGQLELASVQGHTSTTVANSIVRFAFDNDSTTTPISISDISGYSEITDTPAVWSSGEIKRINFKRPIIRGVLQANQQWYNETSPSSSPGALKFYGNGLTASVYYYKYIMNYLVEFQMRSS